MTSQETASAGAGGGTITVSFQFDAGWTISTPRHPDNSFPPGSGLGVLDVRIAPLHLAGLDPSQARLLVDRQIADLGLVSQALALALVQLADATRT